MEKGMLIVLIVGLIKLDLIYELLRLCLNAFIKFLTTVFVEEFFTWSTFYILYSKKSQSFIQKRLFFRSALLAENLIFRSCKCWVHI